MTVTVTDTACLGECCAAVETALGLRRSDGPHLRYKLHNPMDAVDATDLILVGTACEFDAKTTVFTPLLQEE